jgi:hypothetical protein
MRFFSSLNSLDSLTSTRKAGSMVQADDLPGEVFGILLESPLAFVKAATTLPGVHTRHKT